MKDDHDETRYENEKNYFFRADPGTFRIRAQVVFGTIEVSREECTEKQATVAFCADAI